MGLLWGSGGRARALTCSTSSWAPSPRRRAATPSRRKVSASAWRPPSPSSGSARASLTTATPSFTAHSLSVSVGEPSALATSAVSAGAAARKPAACVGGWPGRRGARWRSVPAACASRCASGCLSAPAPIAPTAAAAAAPACACSSFAMPPGCAPCRWARRRSAASSASAPQKGGAVCTTTSAAPAPPSCPKRAASSVSARGVDDDDGDGSLAWTIAHTRDRPLKTRPSSSSHRTAGCGVEVDDAASPATSRSRAHSSVVAAWRLRRCSRRWRTSSGSTSAGTRSGRLSSTNLEVDGEEPAATAASSAGEKSQPAIWLDAMKRVASSIELIVEDGMVAVSQMTYVLLGVLLRSLDAARRIAAIIDSAA